MTSRRAVLLIEDNPLDYEIVERAFHKARLANPIYHCSNGEEALDFLYRRGPYRDPAQAPRPSLILLDLNLPGMGGHEVLRESKENPDLCVIPVIVLTTSKDTCEVDGAYRAGANSYIVKPVGFDNFIEAVRRLEDYWFELVVLPKGEA